MADDLQKKMDELIKHSSVIVATPDTIEKMKESGLPITSKFITYDDYLEKLFAERKKFAEVVIEKLPLLDSKVANATASSLYEEMKECFVMGIPGAAITLAIILFDYSARHALYVTKLKANPKLIWDDVEGLMLSATIDGLLKYKVITTEEHEELVNFNKEIRNNYLHYNVSMLIQDMYFKELPALKIDTGEIVIEKDVDVKAKPFLWFSAKRVRDRDTIVPLTSFCISWINRLLMVD